MGPTKARDPGVLSTTFDMLAATRATTTSNNDCVKTTTSRIADIGSTFQKARRSKVERVAEIGLPAQPRQPYTVPNENASLQAAFKLMKPIAEKYLRRAIKRGDKAALTAMRDQPLQKVPTPAGFPPEETSSKTPRQQAEVQGGIPSRTPPQLSLTRGTSRSPTRRAR